MLKLRGEKKKLFWFTFLKYVEVAITAVTTFILAKQIGPKQMGIAMPVLLYITYANYLSLGINQVVIKNFGRLEGDKQEELLTINFQYLVIANIINVILAYACLDMRYAFLAALVSAGSIFRSYFMSYFRVTDRITVLNVNNLIFSLVLLFSTFFFVKNISDYLLFWAISFGIAFVLYFFSDKSFFINLLKNIFSMPSKLQVKFNLSEGVKLAIAGFISTLLLTTDRLVINRLDISPELKGSYQLGDYAATAYYLFFTTVLFYFYPKLIKKLREDLSFRKTYLRYLKLLLLVLPVIIVLIYIIALPVSIFIFPEYPELVSVIIYCIILKTSVVLINLLSTLYIALDLETKYIKSMIPVLGAYFLAAAFFVFTHYKYVLFIPLVLSLILVINFLVKLRYFERK